MPSTNVLTHWAMLTLLVQDTETGETITITTNNPCHLSMLWTDIPPQKHITIGKERGADIAKVTRFCCVATRLIEQEEAGDTTTHTFIVTPWPGGETRWYRFHGTVEGQDSPSDTPCLAYTRAKLVWLLIILEPWTVTYELPEFELVISEPWTVSTEPPEFEEVIIEPWTS